MEERIERRLGVDVGTNSCGWSIVDRDKLAPENCYALIDAGANIFEEGVNIDDKSKAETSRAAERTMYKHMRVGYWRRKIRKIALLRVLIKHGFCPILSDEELRGWRSYKRYPLNEEFMDWLRTDDDDNKNPYYYRNLCLSEKLDLSTATDRYKLGRALYHINQRRGFLSLRKENTKESDGAVTQSISAIDETMELGGFDYLGQYFFDLYERGEKIRLRYTSRLGHYEKELLAICRKQGLDPELTEKLRRIIITQRPLKSQKHAVGHCVFEKGKTRCHSSHPLFEQYRLYAFINNIKMQSPGDTDMRPLTDEEKQTIMPLFLRKSKPEFKFEEIAKALSTGKKNYCHYKSPEQKDYRFNYYMDSSVSGCPVTAQLADVFDSPKAIDGWLDAAAEVYLKADGKNRYEILNDIWHALFFFESEEKLKQFAIDNLQLSDEKAAKFAKIKMPNDYARLSLNAIRKILPYMKYYGMISSHAIFLANLTKIVDAPVDKEALLPMLPREDAKQFALMIEDYRHATHPEMRLEEYIKFHIERYYNLSEEEAAKLDKCLYHPSMIETFLKVTKPTPDGYFQLGSPKTNSVRNPMAMRSLFRLRHVINTLLAKGKINSDTVIHIEMARELNDSNRRAGIRRWQLNNDKQRKEYIQRIKEHKGADYVPSDDEILKYRLWEEQNHICLYTGDKIGLADLFNGNKYDIEHTVPRSRGGDSTIANLTLCQSRYNRDIKQAKLPSELPDHEKILARIAHWEEKLSQLDKQIRAISTRGVTDINAKNAKIQKRHLLKLERDYWREKINRFKMTEVPQGFARRQGVDIGVISRYALDYLKSLFPHVYIVNGSITAEFRKIWGLQDEYERKSRDNHSHHAIDATTIACIGPAEYAAMAHYYLDEERHAWGLDSKRAKFPKPWATFTEDMERLSNTLIVSHNLRDNFGKRTRKRIPGTNQYMQGDTARSRLHKETLYGAIDRNGEIKYVVRRQLSSMSESDVSKIVDDTVKQKVLDAIAEHGSLTKALEAGIWMNREKGIRINKVRCYASMVKNPIALRHTRDASRHAHKQWQYVTNDSNYVLGIYIGTDAKGREKRDFKLVNYLDAVKLGKDNLLPPESSNGYPLRHTLKVGRAVLLYESSPTEILEADKAELVKRLYKVVGITTLTAGNNIYGFISLRHSQEARPSGELKSKNGAYRAGEEIRPCITMLHTQFNALVEGTHFHLDEDGEIRFIQQ